jgi:hypothetical protein
MGFLSEVMLFPVWETASFISLAPV